MNKLRQRSKRANKNSICPQYLNGFVKKIFFFLGMLFLNYFGIYSQTVTIVDHPDVEVGISSNFTAVVTDLPTGYTVTQYEWEASWLGPDGKLNGIINPASIYINSSETSSTVPIMWDGFFEPGNVDVRVIARGINSSGTSWDHSDVIIIRKNGINSFLYVTGNNNVQKCCYTTNEYEIKDYENGNLFSWTYPAGWTVSGSSTSNKIKLRPNASGGGTVSCTVKRSEALDSYSKSASRSISRYNPVFNYNSMTVPSKLCLGEYANISITPLCGITSYQWTLPAGWNLVSGQGTANISVYTTPSALDGNVQISAGFSGGCSATYQRYVNVINTPPSKPVFNLHKDEYDLGWHCGKFNVCPGGTRIEVFSDWTVDRYKWFVNSPWQVSSTYTSKPWVQVTGPSNAPNSGMINVRAEHCGGESYFTKLIFYKENEYFCNHGYPIWCACCYPPDPGGPPHPLKSLNNTFPDKNIPVLDSKIIPNPGTGMFTILLKDKYKKVNIKIIDINGKLIKTYISNESSYEIDITEFPKGIYFVNIYNETEVETLKLIKQ